MSSDEKTQIMPDVRAGVGTQLSGIYELDERIALGGMGEVYRGHNIQTGDPVAIKIVLPEFARDETILSLFKKEASILNHLSHDAIVRYHVFTIDPGIKRPYLTMEFVNGESLLDVMRRGPMPPEDARKLCLRVASGLAATHEAGIIHRDLSPDNVILPGGRVERAKIIDFGIARSAMVGGKTLLEGKFAGKYNYVSPEQLGLYGGEVSERTDIYSLGLVLAAVAQGEPLDMTGTQVEIIEKRRTMPDLSRIDSSLRPLLEAMLQPDPKDRPPGMADIVAWLAHAEGTVPPQPSPFSSATLPPLPTEASQAWQPASVPPSPMPIPAPLPAGGTTPPASESPFGPYLPPPETPFTSKVSTAAAKEGRSAAKPGQGNRRLALLAGVGVILVSAGGAYYADFYESFFPPSGEEPIAEEPLFAPDEAVEQAAATPQPEPERQQPAALEEAPSQPEQSALRPAGELAPTEPEEAASPPAEGPREHAAVQSVEPPVVSSRAEPEQGPQESDMAGIINDVAHRVSWIRDYAGDGCFYATATSISDKTVEIEGFGRSVKPFETLLKDFQSAFHIEPEIGARVIEPEQCVITDFLRGVSQSSASAPVLTLGQSLISSGAEVHGQLAKLNGRKIDLILIDHKGMAYSLNRHLTVSDGTARFSINVALAGSDLAQNKTVPQVIVAVVSQDGIEAANFSRPIRAAEILPRVLAEIGASGSESTAVAKYFRLGG